MTKPTDEEIREAVDELVKVARKKAIEEATDVSGNYRSGTTTKPPTAEEMERINGALQQVRQRFDDILTPHPDDFDVMIETMRRVESAFGTYKAGEDFGDNPETIGGSGDLAMLDTAKGYMQDWDGKLKNDFVENFLTPLFPAMTSTQGNLARFLRQQAELMKRIYERRRHDAKNIADKSVMAVEAIDDSKGGDLAILLFTVLGVLTGGLAGVVTGPAALAATLTGTAMSLGTTIGGEFVEDEKEVPLGADTVEGVIDNMYKALDESDKTMSDEEDEVIEAFKDIEALVYPMVSEVPKKGNELVPIKPGIVTASDDELTAGLTVYGE